MGDASCLITRRATAWDVSVLLEIGERKREQYEQYSPIFWKKSPTPRQDFAEYVTSQVESDFNIALVAEQKSNISGYIIVQCRNPAEGYVDDYAVKNAPADWATAGVELLRQASQFAITRHIASLVVVTGHADVAKRTAIEQLGFALKKNWFVKPL